MVDGFTHLSGVVDHAGHGIADNGLGLILRLALGHQQHAEGVDVVGAGISPTDRQMVGVQVHTEGTAPVRNHRHNYHPGSSKHPPTLGVPLESVADGLAQVGSPRRLLTVLAWMPNVRGVAPQRCP